MRRKREREREERKGVDPFRKSYTTLRNRFLPGEFPEFAPRELWYIAAWIYKVCKYVEG